MKRKIVLPLLLLSVLTACGAKTQEESSAPAVSSSFEASHGVTSEVSESTLEELVAARGRLEKSFNEDDGVLDESEKKILGYYDRTIDEKRDQQYKTVWAQFGEKVEFEGLFSVTVHQVTAPIVPAERITEVKDDPAQVVVVEYSVENIGVRPCLFLTPTVADGTGEIATDYFISQQNPPKNVDVGSSQDAADVLYGLRNKTDELTITFDYRSSDGVSYQVNFVGKVPKE